MVGRVRERGNPAQVLKLGTKFDDFLHTQSDQFYTVRHMEKCIDSTHKGPPYKSGGPLYVWKSGIKQTPTPSCKLKQGVLRYEGAFVCGYSPPGWTTLYPMDVSEIGQTALMPKAWQRMRLGNPTASMGQFLKELDRIPTLPFKIFQLSRLAAEQRKQLLGFKNLGKEYLNVQFGWLPFLKDLKQMYVTSRTLEAKIAQLKRDNGQWVHRKGHLPAVGSSSSVLTTTTTGGYMWPILTTAFYTTLTQRRAVITESKTRYWYSGRFRYWIPDIGSTHWNNRAKFALFGLMPTPSLLWEVLPYSWLIDWFVNVGDMLSNMSANAVDNQAAKYAYLMAEQKNSVLVNEDVDFKAPGGRFSASVEKYLITKTRTAASPYGFGLTPASLSAKQALILSALGISRNW